MNPSEFLSQLTALVTAYDLREFCIYGRFPETINKDGLLCPPNRLIWLDGEPLVAAEAEYHFGRIAEGKQP